MAVFVQAQKGSKMPGHFLVVLVVLTLSKKDLLVSSGSIPNLDSALEPAKTCFCDAGCYSHGFQTICCDDICKDAEERSTLPECEAKCPGYTLRIQKEIGEKCNHQVAWMKEKIEELEKKVEELIRKNEARDQELDQLAKVGNS